MNEIISKEELDSLSKVKGDVRGTGLKVASDFVLKERGEEGLKLLEETMSKLGYPVEYKRVEPSGFYPLKTDAMSFLVVSRLFNFDDEKIRKLGKALATAPFLLRLFSKYSMSLDRISGAAPKVWEKAYPVGSLNIVEVNAKEKYLILRLENFDILSLYCQLFIGHFAEIVKMVLTKEVTCEETKCTFRGDPYHEFLLK